MVDSRWYKWYIRPASQLKSGVTPKCVFCGESLNWHGGVVINTPEVNSSFDIDFGVCCDCSKYLGGLLGAIWSADTRSNAKDIINKFEMEFYRAMSEYRQEVLLDMYDRHNKISNSFTEKKEALDELEKQYSDAKNTITELSSNGAGYVYLMKRADGAHKIGLSTDVDRRLGQIQKDHEGVELLHTIKCDDMRAAEGILHSQFAEKRLDGEWFDLTQDDIDYIYRLVRFEDGWFLKRAAEQSYTSP